MRIVLTIRTDFGYYACSVTLTAGYEQRRYVSDVANIISQLEQQKAAIDRALSALREIQQPGPARPGRPATKKSVYKRAENGGTRPHITPEGRRALAEAMKRRWAAKRAQGASGSAGRKSAVGSSKRSGKRARGNTA